MGNILFANTLYSLFIIPYKITEAMKRFIPALLILLSSCHNAHKTHGEMVADNISALEQTIDMNNNQVETDNILAFDRNITDLGTISLGKTRELTLSVTNNSDKPVAILSIYTSCHCTEIEWSRKPISPHAQTALKINFTAEQPGVFFKKIAVRHSANLQAVSFAIQGIITDD